MYIHCNVKLLFSLSNTAAILDVEHGVAGVPPHDDISDFCDQIEHAMSISVEVSGVREVYFPTVIASLAFEPLLWSQTGQPSKGPLLIWCPKQSPPLLLDKQHLWLQRCPDLNSLRKVYVNDYNLESLFQPRRYCHSRQLHKYTEISCVFQQHVMCFQALKYTLESCFPLNLIK